MANFWMGTPSRFEKIKKFDPQRESAFDDILQQALSGLQAGGGDFGPIAERETKRFHEDTLPSIAERFTGMGSGGAQRSSGFLDALSRGGTDLSTNLAALGSQHGLQRQSQLMQLLGMGLTPQEDTGYFAGSQGALGGAAAGIGQGLGSLLGPAIGAATGGMGGAGAGGLLSLLMSLLSGGRGQQQQQGSGSIVYQQPNI